MPRYIDIDKLFAKCKDGRTAAFIGSVLAGAEIEDVAPVVHAHWIRTNSGKWRCSRCRGRHDRPKRYCGECGARMNEQKEGESGD